jgi:ParB family transcriptional regulator, chromosome partitioning protein
MKGIGLGRGLDQLLPTNFDDDLLTDKKDRIKNVFIERIAANPDQPRRHFDDAALGELSKSIEEHGVLQPIIVTPQGNDEYIIVAGERRWRAAKLAGLKKMPVIVREKAEQQQLEIALIENVQRVDLSPLEQAISIQKLHDQFNMSLGDIALRLGKAKTTVSNIVRLLQLPPPALDALQADKISEGHARAILSLKEYPDQAQQLLGLIIQKKWSVRQAEQFAVGVKSGGSAAVSKKRTTTQTSETKRLSKAYDAKVTIRHSAKGGMLQFHFSDEDSLKSLLQQLDK